MFLLQQGWQMLSLIEEFISEHSNAGVVLSPRSSPRPQLEAWVQKYKRHDAAIFFDPQFYEPRTDLDKLLSYPYFEDFDFDTSTFEPEDFCKKVIEYQLEGLDLGAIILPGRFTNSLDSSWLRTQAEFAKIAESEISGRETYSTLALGPDIITNQSAFDSVIDEFIQYKVDGAYVVFEHPQGDYLIGNDIFLYALLDATLSIAASGKKIIVGYSNQQSLLLAASGVGTIATGNYRNVRSFDHMIFSSQDMEGWRRNVWYFDGNTLGEYQPPQLSLAFRRGLSGYFGPATEHAEPLLSAGDPGTVPWREPEAFRHYLQLMYEFWETIQGIPMDSRPEEVLEFFNHARAANNVLFAQRFNPGRRSFHSYFDPSVNALMGFIKDRGPALRQLKS